LEELVSEGEYDVRVDALGRGLCDKKARKMTDDDLKVAEVIEVLTCNVFFFLLT